MKRAKPVGAGGVAGGSDARKDNTVSPQPEAEVRASLPKSDGDYQRPADEKQRSHSREEMQVVGPSSGPGTQDGSSSDARTALPSDRGPAVPPTVVERTGLASAAIATSTTRSTDGSLQDGAACLSSLTSVLSARDLLNTLSGTDGTSAGLKRDSNREFVAPLVDGSEAHSYLDSVKLMCRDKTKEDSKNVTIIDVRRNKFASESNASNVLSRSCQSREAISQHGQNYTSLRNDNSSRSVNAREVITSDIPQSLSTDSGIGSPQDSRTGIDLSVGQELEMGQVGKKKMEISSVRSLASGVLPSSLDDRSENYPACIYKGDDPSLSLSTTTSHYSNVSSATGGHSFHSNAFPKHDSLPDNPTINKTNEHLEFQNRTCPEEENRLKSENKSVSICQQNPSTFDKQVQSSEEMSSANRNIQPGVQLSPRQRFFSETKLMANSSTASNNENALPVIRTFHTSEFTVEPAAAPPVGSSQSTQAHPSHPEYNPLCKSVETVAQDSGQASRCGAQSADNVLGDGQDTPITGHKPTCSRLDPHVSSDATARPLDLHTLGRKVKGILKTPSDPTLGEIKDRAEEARSTEGGGEVTSPRSVSFNNTHTKSTFSYNNVAFEGEIIVEPSKRASLAEVVSNMMRQSSVVDVEEDNSHPYGRDSSLTDLMTGKRRDSYTMNAGKMIVWLALAIMIVSLAGGIIFMSETYNLSHRDKLVVLPEHDTTTTPKS